MRYWRFRTVITGFLCTFALIASVSASESDSGNSDKALDSSLDGLEIDSVVIENRNIFDTDEEAYDNFIFRLGNKLHLKTRSYTVRRELLLKKGDLFSRDLADESSRNIRRNLKVYDAWIEVEPLPSGKILMRVITIDEWSLTGGFNYTREGNETRYKIGAEEENFLGNNQFISFYYFAQSDDDNFIEMQFLDKRLLGKPYRLRLDYNNDPINTIRRFAVSHPFYDLQQRFAYAFDVKQFSGRRDIYDDSLKIGESSFDGDIAKSNLSYRMGQYDRKISVGLSHRYRFERSFDKLILISEDVDTALAIASFPDDSLYHVVGGDIDFSRFSYIKLRNIDGFNYTEDYILGYFAGLDYARAFFSDFRGHHYDIAGAYISGYSSNGSNLLRLDYAHTIWFRGGDMLRHFTSLRAKYYHRFSERITLALRSAYTSDWDHSGRDNLILGGTTGIRGYDKFFRTGDRRIVCNAETRLFTDLKILSAMFGGAVFADWGNVWKSDESLRIGDFYASAGVGLRIGFEKSTKNIVRIDVAYSQTNQWEFSIGTNQYFFAAR